MDSRYFYLFKSMTSVMTKLIILLLCYYNLFIKANLFFLQHLFKLLFLQHLFTKLIFARLPFVKLLILIIIGLLKFLVSYHFKYQNLKLSFIRHANVQYFN